MKPNFTSDVLPEISEFKDFSKLERGGKYTLVLEGEMGFVSKIHFTFEALKHGSFAQYTDSVELIFKITRKRNFSCVRFYGSKSFALWEGFVDPQVDPFTTPVTEGIMTVQRTKYLSCDPRYLTDAINSVSQKPLICRIKGA